MNFTGRANFRLVTPRDFMLFYSQRLIVHSNYTLAILFDNAARSEVKSRMRLEIR